MLMARAGAVETFAAKILCKAVEMNNTEFEQKLQQAALEELMDRKIAAAMRRLYFVVAIAFVAGVVVTLLLLHWRS
jgi:hypothetical protein